MLLFAVVIWGWTFVATKICLLYLRPIEVMGLRFLIALPVLLALIVARGAGFEFRSQRGRVVLGSLIIAVHFYLQITALKYTSATNTGWIIAVTPLVLALLAFVVLRERIRRESVIGIAVATCGIVLLISNGRMTELGWLTSVGDWLVLATAHTWALYTITVRDAARNYSPLALTFVVLLPATILAVGVMAFTSDWRRIAELPPSAVLALLFLGVLGTALAHWFWQEGVARVGAAEAGLFLFLEPLATTGLAVPYLGETFGPVKAIGGLMVLLAVWYAQRDRRRLPDA
jgi:drug/metabolite transporter (DMT)-like permease